MDITVAICTRNRAAALDRVLGSAHALANPDGLAWELLVVDNGDGQAARAVAKAHRGALPLRVAHEPVAGLSQARNRAIAEARGRYIVWTDDDVTLDPGWLAAYGRAFAESPQAAVFGGKVTPVLEPPTPRWFAENLAFLQALTAHRDLGDAPAALGPELNRLPFGANYAVRAAEQRNYPYATGLGVAPGVRRVGEEVQVLRAMLSAGATGVWVPDAVVFHQISRERQSEAYVANYHRSLGETWAYLNDVGADVFVGVRLAPDERRFRGAPTWVWRLWLANWAGYALSRPIAPSRLWLRRLAEYAYYRGAIDYWTAEARG